MKKNLFFGILGIFVPLLGYGQTNEQIDNHKVHVSFSQILMDDQGMFAFINGEWLPLSQIECVNHNTYVAVILARWICPACLYNNSEYARTCQRVFPETNQKCGHPRP